jgi:3,4-dihydroxy-2-butanone 4-phosphate synthase
MSAEANNNKKFDSIPSVLDELREGKFVIVVDDEDRENEGDVVIPADYITPENLTFLVNEIKFRYCQATGIDPYGERQPQPLRDALYRVDRCH